LNSGVVEGGKQDGGINDKVKRDLAAAGCRAAAFAESGATRFRPLRK
jgi:hypothetical protein